MSARSFTKEELSQYNGKNGKPVLVAYQGLVYDVSDSFLWRRGVHQVIHVAGHDLSDELKDAPHNVDLLIEFPVVGILVQD